MIGLLSAYLIVLASVRLHQRAHARRPVPVTAEPVMTSVAVAVESAVTSTNFSEQVSALISLKQDSAMALEAASRLSETGDRQAAIAQLRQQLEKDPESFPLKLALARQLLEQGQRPEAISLLTGALGAHPEHEEARILLARALLETQEHEAAGQMAEWILNENDYATEAHDIAASSYMMTGKAAEAIPHLRRMASLEPDNLVFQNRLVQAHMRAGDFDKALQLFQSVRAIDPGNSAVYYNLAACYALQNRPEMAVQTLNEALQLFDPSFVAAWLQGPDFDFVRTNELFAALLNGLPKNGGN